MEAPVIWEEQHKITGKYYKHHSTIIDWLGGKKAYMQHSVDITDTKRAERDLTRRLNQQELMGSYSAELCCWRGRKAIHAKSPH